MEIKAGSVVKKMDAKTVKKVAKLQKLVILYCKLFNFPGLSFIIFAIEILLNYTLQEESWGATAVWSELWCPGSEWCWSGQHGNDFCFEKGSCLICSSLLFSWWSHWFMNFAASTWHQEARWSQSTQDGKKETSTLCWGNPQNQTSAAHGTHGPKIAAITVINMFIDYFPESLCIAVYIWVWFHVLQLTIVLAVSMFQKNYLHP